MPHHKQKIRKRFLEILTPLQLKGHFLDIGSGEDGYFYHNDLKARGLTLTGIDVKPLATVDVVCDSNHMPFCDNSFDGVLCMSVLQYAGYEGTVKEASRVLKKGGIALFEIPSAETARIRRPLRTLIKKWILRKKDKVEVWAGKEYTYEQIKRFHYYTRERFTQLCKKHKLIVRSILNFERKILPQHILVIARKE